MIVDRGFHSLLDCLDISLFLQLFFIRSQLEVDGMADIRLAVPRTVKRVLLDELILLIRDGYVYPRHISDCWGDGVSRDHAPVHPVGAPAHPPLRNSRGA